MKTGLNTLFNEIRSRDILHANSVLLGLGLAKQYIRPYAARHRFVFHRPTRSYGTIHTTENGRPSMLRLGCFWRVIHSSSICQDTTPALYISCRWNA